MQDVWEWLANSPLGTAAKTFVALLLAAVVADWVTNGAISLANWQTWVISAAAASLPVITNAVNPVDQRYGKGSKKHKADKFDVLNDKAGE